MFVTPSRATHAGVHRSLREGYAWAEDKEHCEEYGRMLNGDIRKVRVEVHGMLRVRPL